MEQGKTPLMTQVEGTPAGWTIIDDIRQDIQGFEARTKSELYAEGLDQLDERMADLRVSTTDPDASPMHQKKGASRLGYQTHYVVDGGKARVILDVLVTPAEVTENLPMLEMLFRGTFRWRLRPRSVTGDATYGTRENIAAIEKANIRAYTALADQ
jgi:Transposase DDE domain